LGRIEDEGNMQSNNRSSQGSLRDRFKLLRMREEAGITLGDEAGAEGGEGGALAGLVGRTTSIGLGIGSPTSTAEDSGPTSPPTLARQPTVNPNLAPGTAAGFASGPAGDTAEPVDWDLWQSVVNEGPTAIARTSSEELSHAIACGIPQVIRGVIWQVLAQSKNEELEIMYRELVARGTGKEITSIKTSNPSNGQANGNGKEKTRWLHHRPLYTPTIPLQRLPLEAQMRLCDHPPLHRTHPRILCNRKQDLQRSEKRVLQQSPS